MTTATTTENLDKFRQVYPDAIGGFTDTEAYAARSLQWHGNRMPLAEAAESFAHFEEWGYNEFKPDTLRKLLAEFPDAGIEVTPAREYSVAVYLHLPDDPDLKERIEDFINDNLLPDEVNVVTKFSCLQEGETELVGEALRVWWD